MMKRLTSLLFIAIVQFIYSACLGKTVFYGLHTIKIAEGKELYVKRMVWGLTSDHNITVISPNKDLFDFRATKTDYVFGWNVGPVCYRVENDTLKLYVYGVAEPPANGQFPIKVEQIDHNVMEYREMQDNAEGRGIRCQDVKIDESL